MTLIALARSHLHPAVAVKSILVQGDAGFHHLHIPDLFVVELSAGFNVVTFDALQPIAAEMFPVAEIYLLRYFGYSFYH